MPSERAVFLTSFGGVPDCRATPPGRNVSSETVIPLKVVPLPRSSINTKPDQKQTPDERVQAAVGKYLGQVWRVLCRSGLRPADADDAAQDVFLVLAKRIDDVPPIAERSFLLATALRVASDYRRSAWNRSVTEPLDPEFRDDYQTSPEFQSEQRELLGILDTALEGLSDEERAVFVLMELEQLTREKTAEILKIPAGTVASRYKRAKENFTLMAQRLQSQKRRAL